MSNLSVSRRSWLLSRKTEGQDEVVDAILSGNGPSEETLSLVAAIYGDKVQRSYVEASLLTQAELPAISEYFDIPIEVLELYALLHYDVRGLTRLEKISVIAKETNTDLRQLKSWALAQGFEFIKWRTGGSSRISPVDGLVSLFSDCYFKSKEAFFNANEATASKEAGKWVKQATDISRLLKIWTTDSDEARKDIELALERIEGNDISFPSVDDFGIELNKDEDD